MTEVGRLVPLFSEINDLKRIRGPVNGGSLAENLFRSAWSGIANGANVSEVALSVTAHTVASARLGAIGRRTLRAAGVAPEQISEILRHSFRTISEPLPPCLRARLEDKLSAELTEGEIPPFVDLLCAQPRAGATSPGKPRITLLPPESHGDHCLMVAVYAVLLSAHFGAEIEAPFLAALAHHLHNAWLPDAGFTGEEILGEHLPLVMKTFRSRAAAQLDETVRAEMFRALESTADAQSPEGKAFHAADVIDRVLQMRWYQQAVAFRLEMALEDMQLVHAGPVQAFHKSVLREAGLW